MMELDAALWLRALCSGPLFAALAVLSLVVVGLTALHRFPAADGAGRSPRARVVAGIATLTIACLVLDLALPLGVAAGVLYGLPVVASIAALREADTRATAAVATALVLIGALLSGGSLTGVAALNRALSIAVIWGVALLCGSLRAGVDRESQLLVERARAAGAHEEAAARAGALARSNRDLETFAYRASHDLQEPLRMVSSYTRLLADRYADRLDEAGREFLGFALDGSRRMHELVQGLLELSRVETRAQPFGPVACEEIVETVLRDLSLRIEETHGLVTHDPLPQVRGDRAQIAQVFSNLIGNALKFHADEPPRVHVSARAEDEKWVFAVSDAGIGMEPDRTEEAFELFRRLNAPDAYPGSGLGLAICRRIVERHDGWIRAESKPGAGTTVEFALPVSRDVDPASRQAG